MHYIGPRRTEQEKGSEVVIIKNFPNVRKKIVKSRKCRVPYRTNPNRNKLRHILIKLTRIKHKEKILKAAREKSANNIQGNPHKVNS